jgi:nuclear transport factor 2 (NTF2) superfamily protein
MRAFREHSIAMSYAYKWHNKHGLWYHSYGNENLALVEPDLLHQRFASISNLPVKDIDSTSIESSIR